MFSEDDFHTARQGLCPGPDFEWFAADPLGNIAGFCNAGFATVPATVFSSFELYTRTCVVMDGLPADHSAVIRCRHTPVHKTWDAWAKRGIFGFDWNHRIGRSDPSRPYRLMARPETPLNVSALPNETAAYLHTINLPVDDLSRAKEIIPGDIMGA